MQATSVKHMIAVHSAKGGVGKSTVTANLAVNLAQTGARVGILDADVHGPSLSLLMGNDRAPGPGPRENSITPLEAHDVKFMSMGNLVNEQTPVIWRGAMVHSVINQFLNDVMWGELDYLFLDLPPGTGDAQISIAQTLPLSGTIVVSTPQELSLMDTVRGMNAFRQLQVPILGMVENMSFFVCDDCQTKSYLFGEAGAEIMAEEFGVPLLGRIPVDGEVCTDGDLGQPTVLAHPRSAASRAFGAATLRLIDELEKRQPATTFNFIWKDMNWDERYPKPPKGSLSGGLMVKAVWQVSSDELGIQWDNDEVTTISAMRLRQACPCATCVDEWTGEALLKSDELDPGMTIKEVKSVGRYALRFEFSDGHNTGIYHFKRLRDLIKS